MRKAALLGIVMAILSGALWSIGAWADDASGRIGLGREATEEEIKAWDIAISPRGAELPPGNGTAQNGAPLYQRQCAGCHGRTGREGPDPMLVGGRGSLATGKPLMTIGSYWPYATTVYDYVHRAMPFYAPESLTPDQVYAVTAYLLYLNRIIDERTVIDAKSLPMIHMPNRDGFRPDPRPDLGAASKVRPRSRTDHKLPK